MAKEAVSKQLRLTGIVQERELEGLLPSPRRRTENGYAVIECLEKIPCNPCTVVCPRDAVFPMENINDLPTLDFDKCNGCGICVGECPGLAIFAIDERPAEHSIIKLPHEFNPPVKGDLVVGLGRSGEPLGEFRVLRVMSQAHKTHIVHLAVPKDLVHSVRAISID